MHTNDPSKAEWPKIGYENLETGHLELEETTKVKNLTSYLIGPIFIRHDQIIPNLKILTDASDDLIYTIFQGNHLPSSSNN